MLPKKPSPIESSRTNLISKPSSSPQTITQANFEIDPTESHIKFDDVGGLEEQKEAISDLILLPIESPDLFFELGSGPPFGLLLHGPSGCGKTLLVDAAAGEFSEIGVTYYKLSIPELIGAPIAQSERRLRSLFKTAREKSPSLILLDALPVGASNAI